MEPGQSSKPVLIDVFALRVWEARLGIEITRIRPVLQLRAPRITRDDGGSRILG